ncbi:MAG TPA: Fic family protein, partial [Bellilinea sp.]|nr:Fic family protein [Bellilinea sp.]
MNNIPKYTLWSEADAVLLEIEGLLAGMRNMTETAELTAMSEMAEASFAIEGIEPDEEAEKVYRLLPELDPFSVDDIKKAHRLMMGNQLAGAGTFRREEAGIFEGEAMIYRAGAHEDIPHRLEDLLSWTRDAKEHPIIKSCVFHYEFEAIHPFTDGNGRMGR